MFVRTILKLLSIDLHVLYSVRVHRSFYWTGQLKTHVKKYEKIDPEFVAKVLRHFYFDEFNCGVESYEEGVELYKKVKSRFMKGNCNVRKLQTSNNNLQEFIINRQEQSKSSDEKV